MLMLILNHALSFDLLVDEAISLRKVHDLIKRQRGMGMVLHPDRWWNDLMISPEAVVIWVLETEEEKEDPCPGRAEGVLLDFSEEEVGMLKEMKVSSNGWYDVQFLQSRPRGVHE